MHLADLDADGWVAIEKDLRDFARQVSEQGYNAVTLDDVAHLATHSSHEPEVAARIAFLREKFTTFFDLLRDEFGLMVYLTTDVLPLTPALTELIGDDQEARSDYYHTLIRELLDDFPQLAGMVLRIGESDGTDVKDPIRTQLHLRSPAETNRLLRALLPEFEKRERILIFRTWTVGAHPIGDLIWHRDTLQKTLEGLDSPNLIVSMKHGESDFFRYLPLNRSFFRVKQRKLLELQARREYEGAGEYPSFIGWEFERFASELSQVDGMAGISVWCQTGGWHRFRRRAFLEENGSDIWIRMNTAAAIAVFKNRQPACSCLGSLLAPDRVAPALELLQHADTVVRDLLYIDSFARQKFYFRRVRIPPILHVYWDSLFINNALRKVMLHFVDDPAQALSRGESAAMLFPKMITLAREAGLPAGDIEHMRDFFQLVLLARRYYFLPFDPALADSIQAAKAAYKQEWPKGERQRYRIKISFKPFPVNRRLISLASGLLLRRKRRYGLFDRIVTVHLLGMAFRAFRRREPKNMPKFLRKSAMGVDVLFK